MKRHARILAAWLLMTLFAGLPICAAADDDKPQQPAREAKPSAAQPSAKSSTDKPSGEKPSGEKPSGEKPSGEKPSGEKPSAAKPSASSPLDDELLRELGEEPAPSKSKPHPQAEQQPADSQPAGGKARQKAARAADPLDDELLKQLGGEGDDRPAGRGDAEGAQSEGEGAGASGPIDRLTRQMREVQKRLERRESDADTQQLEKKIVEELEKLIAQANSQSSSSSSSNSKKPRQSSEPDQNAKPQEKRQAGASGDEPGGPARDSSNRVGKAKTEKADPARLQDLMKDIWGELPPRLRQQMMQSSVEHFVPKYEFEIEEYFKTLAERQQEKTRPPAEADERP